MEQIPKAQIIELLRGENPWWGEPHDVPKPYRDWRPRPYFDLFYPLAIESKVHRAVVLMGPRRVGKTVMIHHTIMRLLCEKVPPKHICYLSVDHPVYSGLSIEQLLSEYSNATGIDFKTQNCFIFLDEIQYLKDWEIQLKKIIDSNANSRIIVSGSSAAALRLKSRESGAGRFTDFLLPPLTFYEYLFLIGKQDLVDVQHKKEGSHYVQKISAKSMDDLNVEFVNYLNFGGYPEAIFSQEIQSNPTRFIKSDIIDKVLLRDLPSLYGIQDIQELNYLFTTLAYNTANEISLNELSKNSGVAKNTIKRYIEYLEAAFLVRVVHRTDRTGKIFRRANFFKVYLTNPSIRTALFSTIAPDNPAMGAMVETALFAQWFHADITLNYARWHDGEVDIVCLGAAQKPVWAVEVKWTDKFVKNPGELKSLISFCRARKLRTALITTATLFGEAHEGGLELEFIPASAYCYQLGYNIFRNKELMGKETHR